MHVRCDGGGIVERPRPDESDPRARVLAIDGDLTGRAAPDPLLLSAAARNGNCAWLSFDDLDSISLDQNVDHEGATRLSLAVQTVAAVDEERL